MKKDEPVEIIGIHAKALFKAARKQEQETGRSIEEILIELIYTSDDDMARVNAIRTFMSVMYYGGLDMDSLFDAADLADVVSLRND
jgi:hypothetical protein